MSSLGPNVVAANIIWNMEPIFSQMLEDTKAGGFANKYYRLSVAEDVVQVKTTEVAKQNLEQDTLNQLEETREKIASNKLEVPFVPK